MATDLEFANQFETVFFDLDGTLLGIADEAFEEVYTKLIVKRFVDKIEPQVFIEALWKGTEAMYRHADEDTPVLETFFTTFTNLTGLSRDETYNRFDQFYRNEFGQLENVVTPVPEARKLIDKLFELNKQVVLATNPVFPEIATRRRCEWTNVDFDEFDYVSHAENSHYCKPNPKYYRWLLDIVEAEPETTLMVGNDYLFDMAAAQIGMKTWMIDKFHGNVEYKDKVIVDYTGSLEKLLKIFQ